MDPWRQSTLDAIVILNRAYWEVWREDVFLWTDRWMAMDCLNGALRHLARGDRDIHPKTRRGSKHNKVTRQ